MNARVYPALVLSVAVGTLSQPLGQPVGVQTNATPGSLLAPVTVEAQPLSANVQRLVEALDYLGAPLPPDLRRDLERAGQARDAKRLQEQLDARVLLAVHINPEARVRVARGPAPPFLQQAGYTPVIVKVVNESRGSQRLRIGSPQAGPVYAGMARLSADRMQQQHLRENENTDRRTDRFLELEMFTASPMTANLSGLDVEYAIALIYSSEAGRREATIGFDVGQGTQDLGFRAEVPVLFDVRPAIAVRLRVLDHDGTPTTGRFHFVDQQGHVFPPQPKRLAPDLFFQKHIYRADGEVVLLPPGEFTMSYGRGPEYRRMKRTVTISVPGQGGRPAGNAGIAVRLERWIDPAGLRLLQRRPPHSRRRLCALHRPDRGVDPAEDMFRQVKGEGLNVGCVLTWGPCFDLPAPVLRADARHALSEPLTVMKYDLEVSGFGSQALGHVCLLNLKDQTYPGSDGTATKGWPTWTSPVLRWAKAQGGGRRLRPFGQRLCRSIPKAATARLLEQLDADKDGSLTAAEAARGLVARRLRRRSTPTGTACSTSGSWRPATSGPPISCRISRSPR